MLGWFADLLRIAWGFFYWNFRKSRYRALKGSTRCPCQNPSDSGRAGVTGCDASLHFAKPARFRVVCPLLKPNEQGLQKCSVDAANVRPFWGRVVVLAVFAVCGGYAAITFAVYEAMRYVGYPVSFAMIASPARWSSIDRARAKFYLDKAESAYQGGNLSEAVMALSLAYDYDPSNYEAGLSLAKLWQATRPDASNHLYERLLVEHPEQRTRTAQTWLRALLPRADYSAIEHLAADALVFDPDMVPAWVHALLFANERTNNTALLTRILQSDKVLQPGVREVLTTETEVRARPLEIAVQLLLKPPADDAPAFAVFYQVRRLITLGDSPHALELLSKFGARLSDRDRITLQLLADTADNYRKARAELFGRLVQLAPSLAQIELVAVHLIVHPDPELYQLAKRSIDPMKLTNPGERISALLAMFCTAGANGDQERTEQLAGILRQETGTRYAALGPVAAMMFQPREQSRVELALPALQPLSLELTYALLERFGQRRP